VGIVAFLLIGLLAGAAARVLTRAPDPGGAGVAMGVGVAGALVGGGLAAVVVGARPLDHAFDLATWIAALAGALGALRIYHVAVVGDERRRHAAY
jgi:uncharacterized membrane protein YeaQ/YmgE (transglycosylase-associated protein family)